KADGVLGFSSWVRDTVNPFFDPIVAVLGAPPAMGHSPDQWGDPTTVAERLSGDFDAIDIARGVPTWQFDSLETALAFVTRESPMHVDVLSRVGPAQRESLTSAFRDALQGCVDDSGGVSFDSSYVVVTAIRH